MEQMNQRRIVVAEDESLIRMDIVETLRSQGFDVVGEAGDGLKAIELAKALSPDLMVMDIKMPDMDGLSAAEQIAELRIPVVFLTAFNQQELVARASEVGAMAFLVKPFSPEDLFPAIELALSRHQQLTQLESEVADLNERLETRKLVERAKGVLGVQMGLSEPDAFRWIQKAAMDRRIGMVDVARTILDQLEK
jgi:AmiR/NasT family two-component response regulator